MPGKKQRTKYQRKRKGVLTGGVRKQEKLSDADVDFLFETAESCSPAKINRSHIKLTEHARLNMGNISSLHR